MNPGELCVVSGCVRKVFSVASAPECQCHLVTSAARLGHCLEQQELGDCQSPALDVFALAGKEFIRQKTIKKIYKKITLSPLQ